MISLTHARKQIARLNSKTGFPSNYDDLCKLVDSLRLGSRDKEHAVSVISEALDSEHCPTGADIRKLCEEIGRHATGLPPVCPVCEPFAGLWKKAEVTRKGQVFTAMARCDCPRGRLLATRENQERVAVERPPLELPRGVAVRDLPPDPIEPREYGLCFDPEEFSRIIENVPLRRPSKRLRLNP